MTHWLGRPWYGTWHMGRGSDFISPTQTSVGLRQERTGRDTASHSNLRVASGKPLSGTVSPLLHKNVGGPAGTGSSALLVDQDTCSGCWAQPMK